MGGGVEGFVHSVEVKVNPALLILGLGQDSPGNLVHTL
jgi:hypothetical protein